MYQGFTAPDPNAQYCARGSVHELPDALGGKAILVILLSLNSDERRRRPLGSWISSRPRAEVSMDSAFCPCSTVPTGSEESEPFHVPALSTVGFSLRCPRHSGVMFARVQSRRGMFLQHKVINMAQSGSTWTSDCLGATVEEYGCNSAVTCRQLAANASSLRQPGRLRHSGTGLRPAPGKRPPLSSSRTRTGVPLAELAMKPITPV